MWAKYGPENRKNKTNHILPAIFMRWQYVGIGLEPNLSNHGDRMSADLQKGTFYDFFSENGWICFDTHFFFPANQTELSTAAGSQRGAVVFPENLRSPAIASPWGCHPHHKRPCHLRAWVVWWARRPLQWKFHAKRSPVEKKSPKIAFTTKLATFISNF